VAIRVVVSGTGNMGREVLLAVCRDPDLEPVGVLEKFSSEEVLSLPDSSGLVPLGADALSGRPSQRALLWTWARGLSAVLLGSPMSFWQSLSVSVARGSWERYWRPILPSVPCL